MFHFNRRTLWIIIYITIPLIFVLNQLGPEPEEPPSAEEAATHWSLDEIEFRRDEGLWTVDLPGSSVLRLTVIQNRIPAEAVALQSSNAIRTSQQGGRFLVTVVNPASEEALVTSIEFLRDWLPDGQDRAVVLSGPLSPACLAETRRLLDTLSGTGAENQVESVPALTRLSSPPMGSERQLAFLLWIGVLQQRLSGYEPEVRWDHRARTSEVLINQTLSPEVLVPVTEAELAPVLEAYQTSALNRDRGGEQIHRYLVTTAVYDLPLDFLLKQPQRLASVTLADVDQQRERTLSEL